MKKRPWVGLRGMAVSSPVGLCKKRAFALAAV